MTDYGYKVRLMNEECQTVRFVAFHDDRFLTYNQAGDEALKHLSSQTCPSCQVNHPDDTYVAVDIERGEPSVHGGITWRDAYPYNDGSVQMELGL